MQAIRGLTENISVFVRFFESINNLFCQIRWLEANISNSEHILFIMVLGFVILCIFIYAAGSSSNMSNQWSPILAIVIVVVFAIFKRCSSSSGAQSSMNGILFGRNNMISTDNDLEMHRTSHNLPVIAVPIETVIPAGRVKW